MKVTFEFELTKGHKYLCEDCFARCDIITNVNEYECGITGKSVYWELSELMEQCPLKDGKTYRYNPKEYAWEVVK